MRGSIGGTGGFVASSWSLDGIPVAAATRDDGGEVGNDFAITGCMDTSQDSQISVCNSLSASPQIALLLLAAQSSNEAACIGWEVIWSPDTAYDLSIYRRA